MFSRRHQERPRELARVAIRTMRLVLRSSSEAVRGTPAEDGGLAKAREFQAIIQKGMMSYVLESLTCKPEEICGDTAGPETTQPFLD